MAVMIGASLYDVQKLLGHQGIAMAQRYAHLSDEGPKRATAGVASWSRRVYLRLLIASGESNNLPGIWNHLLTLKGVNKIFARKARQWHTAPKFTYIDLPYPSNQ